MKNICKRAAAGLLALMMCLGFAGCYSENNTWAARKGDITLPIGGYIYYLYSAYSDAASQVDTETAVLDSQIEGEDASQWIRDEALNYLQAYYYINDKFTEYGLEWTDEDQTQAESLSDSYWSYYKSVMEPMGIAQSSFEQVYGEYTIKMQKVLQAAYGEGGELALADGELKQYFEYNYYSYEYFYAPLTTTNEDGESETMSEEDQNALEEELQKYVDRINDEEVTVSEAADEYAADAETDSTYYKPTATKADNLTSELASALESVDEGETTIAQTSNALYVIRRLSIADAYTDEIEASEDQQLSLLSDMKGQEFYDYVMEQAAAVEGIEINQSAINNVKISKLVNDSNRNGTSSESSSSESSDTEDTSSTAEESSESSAEESSSEVSSEVSSEASSESSVAE